MVTCIAYCAFRVSLKEADKPCFLQLTNLETITVGLIAYRVNNALLHIASLLFQLFISETTLKVSGSACFHPREAVALPW